MDIKRKLGIWSGTGIAGLVAVFSISSCAPPSQHAPPAPAATSQRAIVPEKERAIVPAPAEKDSKPAQQSPTQKPATQKPAQKPAPIAAASSRCELRAHGDLPDPACTPGEADQRVTQSTIKSTICVTGYTKTVRPSSYVTNKMKFGTSYPMYGLRHEIKTEYDHLIPLELGGKSSIKNLWPDPTPVIPTAKDATGNRLHEYVCDGRMSLATAQHVMATDWRTAPTLENTPPPAPVTPQKPAPPAAPKAPESSSAAGYHWRQQANGLRCVDGDGQFAKKALCGAKP